MYVYCFGVPFLSRAVAALLGPLVSRLYMPMCWRTYETGLVSPTSGLVSPVSGLTSSVSPINPYELIYKSCRTYEFIYKDL